MASKKVKTALLVVLVLVVIGLVVAYFMWNKPRRTVANEKGIEITTVQLVKEFQANETEAHGKYHGKALQVTGPVGQVDKNQDGKTTVMLSSDDPFMGVFCTLKEDAGDIANGSTVTIKGFYSGVLSDVRLSEAVVVK